MHNQRVGLIGGTGFVGRNLAHRLASHGIACTVLTRHPHRHRDLLTTPGVTVRQANVFDQAQLTTALQDCDAVINLVGILNESRRTSFERAHIKLVEILVAAAAKAGVKRLLHMSALGAGSDAPSDYLKYKAEGENAAHLWANQGLHTTSFRPSVMFGPDDSFFNRFATLLAMSPIVFPLACPAAPMAPVYVADVARVFADSLTRKNTYGQHYDLCGPNQYSLRELVEYTARVAGLKPTIVPLGDTLSRLQARILEWVPGKPFSRDNYLSLQANGTCEENGFEAFGFKPTSLECIVPSYIGGKGKLDTYQDFRRAAGR